MRSGLEPPPQTSAFFDLLPDCLPDGFRTLPEPRPKTLNLQSFRIASGRFRIAWGLSKDLKKSCGVLPKNSKNVGKLSEKHRVCNKTLANSSHNGA